MEEVLHILTENGCAAGDHIVNGKVEDRDRVDFLSAYMRECRQAITEGVNLKGYFVWSFLDNFEWSQGYDKRFGLHYVDYKTGERIPKSSARWYKRVIQKNGLSDTP